MAVRRRVRNTNDQFDDGVVEGFIRHKACLLHELEKMVDERITEHTYPECSAGRTRPRDEKTYVNLALTTSEPDKLRRGV